MKNKTRRRKIAKRKSNAGQNLVAFNACVRALHGFDNSVQIVALAATAKLLGISVTIGK